ncbi:hypothetical protein BJY04DRAFT_199616 [Aspergillus karnatakaensis]|uniref:uncharacterized protein n=1 Tax=Aspergillus karnatakaensis TaxID=1810916 RepID=UPI003CCE4AD8
MRPLTPIAVLATALATTATAKTWGEALTDLYGPCASKCAFAEFKTQGKCGDPADESTTRCYCEKFPDMTIGIGKDFAPCIKECGVKIEDLVLEQWSQDIQDICDGDFGGVDEGGWALTPTPSSTGGVTRTASESETEATPTTTSGEQDEEEEQETTTTTTPTPTPSASEEDEGDAGDEGTPSTEADAAPTDAASSVSAPRAALIAGFLAALGYTL